jgi:hypothetical protein
MLKVAGGDLTADASFPGRTDEIGSLASALGTFKQNAIDKTRIEDEQRVRRARRSNASRPSPAISRRSKARCARR